MKEKQAQDFELKLTTLRGKTKNLVMNAAFQDGAMSGMMMDITDCKQMEKRLLSYRTLFNNIPIGLYRTTPEGEIIDANPALVEMLGYPDRESLLGISTKETYVNPGDLIRRRDLIEEKGILSNFQYQLRRKDGSVIWVEGSSRAVRDEEGRVRYFEGSLMDINERKRVEEALLESEKRYRLLAENVTDIIWTMDLDLHFTYISPSVTRILGYTVKEALAQTLEEALTPSSCKMAKEVLEEELMIEQREQKDLLRSRVLNLEEKCKDGSTIWTESTITFLRDSDRQAVGILGITRDITGRKEVEDELRRSHRQLRSLARHLQSVREEERKSVAREIHDELGQALTALKIDVSWLSKKLPKGEMSLDEKVRGMKELIDDTIQKVKRISTSLRPGLLDDLGLSAAMEWQGKEFERRTGIRCRVEMEPEEVILENELSTAVFRIFQELLMNVARHSGATRVEVNLEKGVDRLELRVVDNGKGITEKQISAPKSLGLLGIRERVHPWGGEVRIEGIPRKGTAATVLIPFK